MNQDNPPSVSCPKCGKPQVCQPIKPIKIGVEVWLFEMKCECGGEYAFSDHYFKSRRVK